MISSFILNALETKFLVFFQGREAGGGIKPRVEPKAKPWVRIECHQARETGGSHLAVAHFVGCGALY